MNRALTFALVAVLLSLGAGCASTGMTQTASAGPAKWESVTLANGVKLEISDDAGPEARRVAEQIQSEMRSRYLGAR
jgi:hypothetical protein